MTHSQAARADDLRNHRHLSCVFVFSAKTSADERLSDFQSVLYDKWCSSVIRHLDILYFGNMHPDNLLRSCMDP